MDKERFNADELIARADIAAKIIIEESGIDESAIDAALAAAYAKDASTEEWERQTRTLLGLNPYWHDREEGDAAS